MKIVEIIPQLSSGGAERFVVDLCNELCERHEVTLIVYYDILQYGFYANELSSKVNLISMEKKAGFSFTLMKKLCRIIKRISPDVLHLHTRAINYALPAVLFNDVRTYMTIHSAADKEAGGIVGKLIRTYAFKKGIITPVAISSESLKSFKLFYGFSASMIPNGRNVEFDMKVSEEVIKEFRNYRKTPSTRVLVQIARFTSVKRQDLMARVVDRLLKEGYDLCCLMLGRQIEKDIVDKVRQVDCPNIYVLGEKNNPLEYLKLADAFCLCSSYEGMPISLIEAMGMGTIPVCTPVGGIVDVVNEANGFLSTDDTEDAYYLAMKNFMDADSERISKMQKQLRMSYMLYSMTDCAKKYEQLFKPDPSGLTNPASESSKLY